MSLRAAPLLIASVFVSIPAGCAPSRTASATPTQQTASTIGRSVNGLPIRAVRVGSGDYTVAIVGGIHGSEPEGLGPLVELVDLLRAQEPPVTVAAVFDMNPDSSRRRRTNANGIDLNRNWPASNFAWAAGRRGISDTPLSEPETAAVYDWLAATDPDVILVLHSIARGPFVNFDGPAAEPATTFATAADAADTTNDWTVIPAMGYPTPGSMGSLYGIDRNVPILTIEFDRGHDPAGATAALRAGVQALIQAQTDAPTLPPTPPGRVPG